MFTRLTDDKLIEAYKDAVELNLEKDFIKMLEEEMKLREIIKESVNK